MVDMALTFSVVVSVVFGGVLLLWILHCTPGLLRASKSGARPPKGSFGWPIIGESLDFARNPATFASSHFERYGSIFKSSLFLHPTILGKTPQFAKFVLGNDDLFVSGWPASLKEINGPKSFVHKYGPEHLSIKKILQKPSQPDALRTKVKMLESIILENLASWAQIGSVVGGDVTPKIVLDTGLYLLIGVKDLGSTPEGRSMIENLETFDKAVFSPPVNLPGTPFNKGLKAKAVLTTYLKGLLAKRKGQENTQADFMGVLSAAQEDPQALEEVKGLDDDSVADNLIAMWFGFYQTIVTTLTWIPKFLLDNPDVFRRIQAEQQEIFDGRDLSIEEPRLTLEDTKKMVYASKFYQEVQRTLSIAPILTRKATQDVEFDGYLIPKGWRVAPMCNFIHSDPSIYPNPERFNPDRFDVPPKPFTYLAFSAGTHLCPGMEVSKLISLIYIHHLTTTYVFESAMPDNGMEYQSGFPVPIGGCPINIRRRN